MIYKDFIAEAAEKIMASTITQMDGRALIYHEDDVKKLAQGSVRAAKALADALDQDWQEQTAVDGIHRYAEGETFFDNYVNWTKTK